MSELDLGRLAELIELNARDGVGTTISPVQTGQTMGGYGSPHRYTFDGWEVGYIAGMSGGEDAVGATIAEAVEAALEARHGA